MSLPAVLPHAVIIDDKFRHALTQAGVSEGNPETQLQRLGISCHVVMPDSLVDLSRSTNGRFRKRHMQGLTIEARLGNVVTDIGQIWDQSTFRSRKAVASDVLVISSSAELLEKATSAGATTRQVHRSGADGFDFWKELVRELGVVMDLKRAELQKDGELADGFKGDGRFAIAPMPADFSSKALPSLRGFF